MPPGKYIFDWKFDLGPWCGFDEEWGGEEYSIAHTVGQGNFSIFIDDGAPWPAFTQTSCASLAGHVAFATTSVRDDVAFDHGTPVPITCAITQPVTETPQPCLATVDAVQAASISSIMTWIDDAAGSPTSTSTSSPTASTAGVITPVQTPSLAGDLRPTVYGLVALFAGLILGA
ncbi:hypothetical protein GE09DRAFT_306072 [Coniochaeta sp. 2T2.1]|nr:hypothetical protein GE09DRAFT_306072 [Coniochaeta sp. 2T2.1]